MACKRAMPSAADTIQTPQKGAFIHHGSSSNAQRLIGLAKINGFCKGYLPIDEELSCG